MAKKRVNPVKSGLRTSNRTTRASGRSRETRIRELRADNNALEALVANISAGVGVLLLDRNFRIKHWSPALPELLHVPASAIGRTLAEFAANLPDAELITDAAKVLRGSMPIERELRDSDDNRRYLRRIAPFVNGSKRISGALLSLTDITDQKQSATPTLVNQDWFSQFMQNLPGLAWIKDLRGRYVFANSAALKAFGRTAAQMLGNTDSDFFSAETAAAFRHNDQLALNSPLGIQTIESLEHSDGVKHHSVVAKFPIRDTLGAVRLVGGMAIDITERLQAESALQVTKEQLALVTDTMAVGVTHCSRDLRYLWVNEHYARTLNHSPSEIIGRPIVEILGERLFSELHAHFEQVLTGQRVSYEQEIRYPGIPTRWVKAEYSPTFDAAGVPNGWVAVIIDLTSRRHAEQALRDSEARKSAILFASPDAIISIDQQGIIWEWNPAAEQMFGWLRADVVGKRMVDVIIPAAMRTRFHTGLAKWVATGVGHVVGKRLEMVAQRHDGSEFPAEVTVIQVELEGSSIFKGFVRDITDRKQAEVTLRESEARFRALTDAAPMLVWMSDADKHGTYFNESWLRFTGRTVNQEVGKGWLEGIHPNDRERYLDIFGTAFERRESFEMEYRLRHHDGQYRWIVDHGVPRFGPDGTFLGYIGSCFDIHDRKQSQVALFASEQHLRLATEGARIGTWHWDLVTNQASWNEIECELIGCDLEIRDTTAEEFFNRVHNEDRSDLRRAVQRAIERDEPYDHEFRVVLPNGQTRWLAGKGEVYRDELGRPLMMMGVNFDISDRKQLELQLTLTNESLEQQVAERINTINLMSKQMAELADSERQQLGRELHDTLGQDCTAISMLVTTLKHQLRDLPQHMELVDRLEYTAETAKKQVRRLAKGLFPVDLDADGLRVAFEDLAEETARVHRVKCRLDCRSSIHWLDNFAATQLYLVVREAVHNAVKHAQPSQIVIRVEDSAGRRVSVWDNGNGLYSTGKSTGMGLSIMRYRCELIGGRLRFESHTSSGTIVSILLPNGTRRS